MEKVPLVHEAASAVFPHCKLIEILKVKIQMSRKRFIEIPWKFRNSNDMSLSTTDSFHIF